MTSAPSTPKPPRKPLRSAHPRPHRPTPQARCGQPLALSGSSTHPADAACITASAPIQIGSVTPKQGGSRIAGVFLWFEFSLSVDDHPDPGKQIPGSRVSTLLMFDCRRHKIVALFSGAWVNDPQHDVVALFAIDQLIRNVSSIETSQSQRLHQPAII